MAIEQPERVRVVLGDAARVRGVGDLTTVEIADRTQRNIVRKGDHVGAQVG